MAIDTGRANYYLLLFFLQRLHAGRSSKMVSSSTYLPETPDAMDIQFLT